MSTDKTKPQFRLRAPSINIENIDLIPGKEAKTWLEALTWLQTIKGEHIESFRLQVNLKREKGNRR